MSEIVREAEVCDHCGTDERTLGQLTRRAEAAERERERLRGALERAHKVSTALVRYFSVKEESYFTTKHTWMIWEIHKALSAALAGEGEAQPESDPVAAERDELRDRQAVEAIAVNDKQRLRDRAAVAAMQGLLASDADFNVEDAARWATRFADALVAALYPEEGSDE